MSLFIVVIVRLHKTQTFFSNATFKSISFFAIKKGRKYAKSVFVAVLAYFPYFKIIKVCL
jgi:hypothetical protein